MTGLTIYKASAGSGKTFAITREYINLLFRDPENYRHILGVTFTNKATASMKNRIISELDKLAKGEKTIYAEGLMKLYNLDQSQVMEKASVMLMKILHDYAHFNILTIDSFFHRVIRAFAKEIGYYQGFDIELDQGRILTAAVEQMIFELESNPELKNWLVSFAEEKIVEGNTWNFDRDIERIGRETFKENFKEFDNKLIEKITNKQFLQEFNQKLNFIKTEFETKLRMKGQTAVDLFKHYSIVKDDLKQKSRSILAFFERTANGERTLSPSIRNHYNDIDLWVSPGSPKKKIIEDIFNDGANTLLSEIIDMHDLHMPVYYSAVAVQKHLHVLGMIADLLAHIREVTSNKNLFLISDTAQFLQQLIKGSDTPFVYERTGTFIHHFMIDEFQDTSALQWNNFRPLILNSLSENNENWIVGDVKQSIYRWRNSDWTILSEKVFNDLKPFQINEETLTYNWRSSRNVISFNNSFFRNAIDILLSSVAESYRKSNSKGFNDFQQLFTRAYSDFMQLVPEHKNIERGMVDIQVIPRNGDKSVKFEEEALERLRKIIEEIQDRHYDLKDIAILVRERTEGDTISEFLLKCQQKLPDRKYRYDVLSNDSLLLKNSEVVKWIIAAFRYIVNPSDQLNKTFLAYEYCQYLYKTDEPALSKMFDNAGNVHIPEKIESFFKQKSLRHYPVYELCDMIILYFGLSQLKNELPFIQAFQDMLMDYTRRESSDLNSFLYWWEENEDKRVLNMPDDQDAIRLMTLHSAKGLEFKIVIIPFANWSFMKAGWSSIIWCKTNKEPFNIIDMVPLNFNKSLQSTIFSSDYIQEQALSYIDNLNLLYVAFTRAIDAFYVIVPEQEKEAIDNVGTLITTAIDNQFFDSSQKFPAIRLGDYWNLIDKHLVFGALPLQEEKAPATEIKELDNTYTVRPVSDVVKQVVQAKDYFTKEGEMLASRINAGRIMHEVFQRIKTRDDIDNALMFLLLEGKIQKNDLPKLNSKIKESISHKPISDWFSSDWEVLTETGILLKTGMIPRPDRVLVKGTKVVVIDYKFGESEHPSHLWQVRNYMQYLRQMNNKDVTGYLWYPNLKKVVPVDFTVVQGTLF